MPTVCIVRRLLLAVAQMVAQAVTVMLVALEVVVVEAAVVAVVLVALRP